MDESTVLSMKPQLTVWTAPALGGKTRRCIQTCVQAGAGVRLILPSDLQAQMARAILMAEGLSESTAYRMVQSLHSFALEIAGTERFRTVPLHLRRWLLQEAVRIAAQHSSLLARASEREGILTLLSAWVRELAREGVAPDTLHRVAQHFRDDERLTGLAQVWQHYRQLLKVRGWHEEEDVYAIAAQAWCEQTTDAHRPRRVVLDGFSRFSRGELELLRALAQSSCEVIVTLCWDEGRDALFESTTATLQRLSEYFEVRREHAGSVDATAVSPAIARVAEHLFGTSSSLPANGVSPEVEIWEAPHLLAEAEMIAREIVRLHAEGTAWGEIAVLCRDLASVLPTLHEVLEQFGVPAQSFEMRMLVEHPLVRTLVGFMRLPADSYPRDAVVGWLKSGYLPLNVLDADRLRLLAVRRGVRSGADSWLHLADEMEREGSATAPLLRGLIEHTQNMALAASAEQWLSAFQDALSAMRFGAPGAQTDPETGEVLSQAMEVAQQVAGLLNNETGGDAVQWAEAVVQAWAVTPQRRSSFARNAVWLLEATRSRPLQPRVAFVMGMQEGRFPRRINEDALLRDEERRWLNAQLGCWLPMTTDAAAMERLVFYQAATCAKRRVVFTYSRTEGDHDVQPSFYLRALRDLFPAGTIRQRSLRLSDITVPLAETLGDDDAERTLVDSVFDRNPHTRRAMDDAERQRTAEALYRWLQHMPERCRRWWRWRYLPSLPRLSTPQSKLGARAYSATELEDLYRCPFRHFVRWDLKIRPEHTHYAAGQGRWLHAALHRRQRQPDRPIEEVLKEVVQDYPVDRSTGERHLLMQQVEDMVRSVVEREENVYASFGLQTFLTEATFGPATEEDGEPAADVSPPLQLILRNGERVPICGRIDRVDIAPDSGFAVLVDYKRDLPNNWLQVLQSGEDFQTVLYVAALRKVWQLTLAAVALDGALDGKRCRILFHEQSSSDLLHRLNRQPQEAPGVVQRMTGERWKSIERTTAAKVSDILSRYLEGNILPTLGDHCTVCEYRGLCRVEKSSAGPVHDGEPYPSSNL